MEAQPSGRTVVVGIDGSRSALRAVQWAAAEAARRNLPVRIVMALEWQQGRAYGRLGADYRQIMLGEGERLLAQAVAVAEKTMPVNEVEHELILGSPIPVLRAESRNAALLVVGDRGYGAISGLLLGSVAAALAGQAECPVVLVRGEGDEAVEERTRPVVVGVDGSPVSEAALAFAFEAAYARGVPMIAVHTWSDRIPDPQLAPLLDWDAVEADEQVVLAERLAGWDEKYPDVRVHRRVIRDPAAHALVEESRRAQLVVVGSRGRSAAAGLLLGSVSRAVLHRSHCSVAIVRPPGESKD